MGAPASQRGEPDHEEVQPWEGNHVDRQLAEIRVELSREAEAGSDARHYRRDQMVQIAVRRVRKLESPHADVIEGLHSVSTIATRPRESAAAHLVVDAERLVGILDQLMNRQRGVVRLHDGIGYLGARHDREGRHHTIREFLTDLGDQQGAHAGTGSTTKGVGDLEALEAVATFSLTANDVEHLVDQFGALSVVALCPVVASTGLAEDEVVRTEQIAERTGADGVHGAGLEIHQHSTRDILVVGRLYKVRADIVVLKDRSPR